MRFNSWFILDGCEFDALKILEAATLKCKTRDIDTPEVIEALDVLAPYCRPERRITGFRDQLETVTLTK